MSRRAIERLLEGPKQWAAVQSEVFKQRYGQTLIDLLELPVKIVLSPFTLAIDAVGSAPRGFGFPKMASDLAFSSIFLVATIGTYDLALELTKKVLCPSNCRTCNGWRAIRCTTCRGTGRVRFQVLDYVAEDAPPHLLHLPSAVHVSAPPLPSKRCQDCDASGVMGCPECKHRRLNLRISADDIMEPPWKAYNVLRTMDYPYHNIVDSMKDPKIAAFWLLTMPQIMGDFNFDDDVKQKIWWTYKESMRYDQLRDVVAKRKPGWEHLQNALISIDPDRAKDDPVIVRNVPYYKAKKALEAEVMKLSAPPRPSKWGDLDLPLKASSWTKEDMKDPKKLLEMTSLLNAQREIADNILDAQWEAKWRQDKLDELLKEKIQPYIEIDTGALPEPIVLHSKEQEKSIELLQDKMPPYIESKEASVLPRSLVVQCEELEKKRRKRRWFFF